MPTGLLTISQYTANPPDQVSVDSLLEVRGWYSRSFIAGDGVTPVFGSTSNGQSGFYYSITPTLNGSGDLVVPAHEIQATTLSNPTGSYFEGLWVNGAFVCLLMPNTQGAAGWQIPTVYGDPIAYDEIATYNRAKRLLYPPDTYFTADQTIEEIRRIAGNFDYMAVGVNGIGQASFPPVVASVPIVLMENDPKVGDWFNIEAYFASTGATAAQNAVFIAAAVAAAASAGGGIYVPIGTFVCNTVSITVPIMFADGGIISAPSGQTITYTKSLTANIAQHFAGLGAHVFSGKNLAILYPQYWGIANDGTTVDTVPFQAFVSAVNSSHAAGYLTPNSRILLGAVTTVNTARGLTLGCDIDARNFNPNAPELIWDGTGGTMFDFEQGQQVLIHGIYFRCPTGKSIDTFLKFDGDPTTQIGTQGTVRYCSFDAVAQSNASAKLISISPTASGNHENYYVGYSDFYVSSGVRATAAGSAIVVGASSNAKHQVFEHLGISQAAIGISVLNGSVDISHIGGGANGIGVKIAANSEPCTIDHYEAEADLQAIVVAASNGPNIITNCRFSNPNQTNTGGFVKLDGVVMMSGCRFEEAPPVGGTLIEDAATGGLYFLCEGTKWPAATVTLAQAGLSGFNISSRYAVNPSSGISDAVASSITNEAAMFGYIGNSAGVFQANPFQINPTWSDAGTAFIGLQMNVTNTASAAGALLADLKVGGVSKFSVSKAGAVAASDLIKSSSPTAGVGYATGAGGAQTQSTDKSTTVVSNTITTAITMNNAALNAGVTVSFTFTNSAIAATDTVICTHQSGGTSGAYTVNAFPGAGSAVISVRNNTAGNLSEAIVLRITVIKSVSS